MFSDNVRFGKPTVLARLSRKESLSLRLQLSLHYATVIKSYPYIMLLSSRVIPTLCYCHQELSLHYATVIKSYPYIMLLSSRVIPTLCYCHQELSLHYATVIKSYPYIMQLSSRVIPPLCTVIKSYPYIMLLSSRVIPTLCYCHQELSLHYATVIKSYPCHQEYFFKHF